MKDFEKEVIEKLTRIDEKLSDYSEIKEKVNTAYNKSCCNESDIKDMKDSSKWLKRTTIGGIILIILNLLRELFIK